MCRGEELNMGKGACVVVLVWVGVGMMVSVGG